MTTVPHWQAVAISSALRKAPKRVVVDSTAYVIFRDGGTVACIADRCPHRHAPLSGGRVVDGTIECPYHGWRFDGAGVCRAMPGLVGVEIPRVAVPRRIVKEAGGLVFVAVGEPEGEPYACSMQEAARVSVYVENVVSAPLVDVAENVLDATHTHFTHKGLLRGLSSRRNRVEVTVEATERTVEARYEGEPRQDGIVSRLLEGGRTIGIGRFIAPGIAELEFHGAKGANLVTTLHFREETPGVTRGIAVLAGPRRGGLGHLKAMLFRPLFQAAYLQDRHILTACVRNRREFGDPAPLVGPLDVLRADIAVLASGGRLAPGSRSMTMSL